MLHLFCYPFEVRFYVVLLTAFLLVFAIVAPKGVLVRVHFCRFCKIMHEQNRAEIGARNMKHYLSIWKGRRQRGGLSDYADSAQWCESVLTPAPPAGVR